MMQFALSKKLHASDGDMNLRVSYEIGKGQFVGLYGPSGAGKTSMLRMLAGFSEPDRGFIKIEDQEWFNSEKGINLPPQKRRTGVVFQDNALFPNMNVRQNLAFALDKGASKSIIDEMLHVTGLEPFYNRRVQTLSGGQKQRVALARALVRKPDLLLLDEPLSAIDEEMRLKMQDILFEIHLRYQPTTILVSHDIAEMVRLCDQVILLNAGQIERTGEPAEVFFERQQEQLRFYGSVVRIKNEGAFCRLSILVGSQLVNIITVLEQTIGLSKGDKVLVQGHDSKAAVTKIV